MALTQQQLACREIVAESKARLHTQQSDNSATYGDKIIRYWEGIPHGLQDDCLAFLKAMTSASNTPNIVVAGDPSPYDVTGEYLYSSGQWTMGTHIIKAAVFGGDSVYELSNIYGEILYRSDSVAGELPEIDDAVWTAIGVVSAGTDWSRPVEFFMTGDFALGLTYTTTGTIATSETLPSDLPQTTVQDPQAEWQTRYGAWTQHALSLDRKGGVWTISQTLVLANDGTDYILFGYRQPAFFKREIRLYQNVAEAQVPSLIESLSTHPLYVVESDEARKTSIKGIFDIYVTLLHIPVPETTQETSYQSKEGGFSASSWKYVSQYDRYISDWYGDDDGVHAEYAFVEFVKAYPAAYGALAKVRRVTVTVTKRYYKAEPTRPLSSATATGIDDSAVFDINGSKKYRLQNGMWVTEEISTDKLAWGTSDAES